MSQPRQARSHGAGGSALGFVYQIDVALLQLLARSRSQPELRLYLERLDDIEFETDGEPTELLQTKHHIARAGSLTDTSRDVWRTLGAWSDAITRSGINPSSVLFSLLTTATAPSDSAAASLRPNADRDPSAALETLELVARQAQETTNEADYLRFLGLSGEQRLALVTSMRVLDATEGLRDLEFTFLAELRLTANPIAIRPLLDRLLSWWHRRVVQHLLVGSSEPIGADEVLAVIYDLQDQLASDNLPIDYGELTSDLPGLEAGERTFVRQLQLIAAGDRLIELAIRDYKQAFAQRTRWVRDALLLPGELERYEQRLVEEWESHFAMAARRHADAADEPGYQRQGFEVFEAANSSQSWIRDRVKQPFVVRGTYHGLADDMKVGWHPAFVERLRELLAPRQ